MCLFCVCYSYMYIYVVKQLEADNCVFNILYRLLEFQKYLIN